MIKVGLFVFQIPGFSVPPTPADVTDDEPPRKKQKTWLEKIDSSVIL